MQSRRTRPSSIQPTSYSDSDSEGQSQLLAVYQAMPQLVDHLNAMKAHAARREAENKILTSSTVDSQSAQSTQLQLLTSGGLKAAASAIQCHLLTY